MLDTEQANTLAIWAQRSREWHAGQEHKAGKPNWTHPARVAHNVTTLPGFSDFDDQTKNSIVCTAYLHDVIEDTKVTAHDLRELGLDENSIQAVLLLSKNHEYTTTEAYCARIVPNLIARAVKLADLSDNCNLQRQAELRAQGIEIDETKYPKVLSLLKPNLEEIAWFQVVIRFEPTP
jgi:hypothetical protein